MVQQWEPEAKHLKQYPHFDAPIDRHQAIKLANSPELVARNPFFPFLQYKKSWVPFRGDGRSSPKDRLIRYACRRDSIIFSRYRHFLSDLYEERLKQLALDGSVVAYRKIPVSEKETGGKCNIHFAKEAFEEIKKLGTCCAVVMDISKYFENIDHQLLKDKWCQLLGESSLPDDQFAVYKAITRYAVVDRTEALQALGYLYTDGSRKDPSARFRKQLCNGEEFREKIAGGGKGGHSLIKRNSNPYGIPQGAPLSDVLANLYLIDFDAKVLEWVERKGGIYRRYSDDLLVVVPGGQCEAESVFSFVSDEIRLHGEELRIKPEKTSVVCFLSSGGHLTYSIPSGARSSNGLEYLGFRFDGSRVYLRDSTVSRFYRRLTYFIRREIISLIKRYPGKRLNFLRAKIDICRLERRFGRVQNFDPSNPNGWTFWTYAQRASRVFGAEGSAIIKQVRSYRDYFRRQTIAELNRQYERLS